MERALKEAGTCGRFQVYHVIFTQMPRFVAVWGMMLMMFGGYNPGWKCVLRDGISSNESILPGYTLPAYDSATEFSRAGESRENITGGRDTDGRSRLALIADGSDGGIYPHYNATCDAMVLCQDIVFNPASKTIVSEFKLVCGRETIVKYLMIMQSVGLVVGALVCGQVGEKFGRKVSLYGGTALTFLASLMGIFSVNWIMYGVSLFLVGVGTNCIVTTTPIFSMEFLNSKWRSFYGSIPTWNLSLCVFTLATAVMKSWVHVHVVTCVLSAVACIGYFILPESLRWLVVNGRQERAERVVQKVARLNAKPELSMSALQLLKEESTKERTATYTYVDLFRNGYIRILTFKFLIICIVIFMTYMALGFGVQALPGDYYTNAIYSTVCEILVVLLTGPLCRILGRKMAGVGMSLLGAGSCAIIVIALFYAEGDVQSTLIKSFAFLARSGSQGISAVSIVFMSELFPTAVRIVSFGLIRTTSGVGGILAPFLIPSSGRESFAVCFGVMCFAYVVTIIVFLTLPETNKLCLNDDIANVQERTREEEKCGDDV